MASQAAGRDVPNDPRDEPDSSEPQPNHPEPACQEAQKWIEVRKVTVQRGSGAGGLLLQHNGDTNGTYCDRGYKYIAHSPGASSPVHGGNDAVVSGYCVGRRL
ncbi:hypothetical protein PAMP_021252 [Pampus punctatissimus]